jgi:hypothetical protein
MSGNIVIRDNNNPDSAPVVLLGRKTDETDIGLAFHAYERAKDLAFSLDGFRHTPFANSDRDERFETLVSLLTEFGVNARRYIELSGDSELNDKKLSESDGLSFRFATNRLVHSLTYIPIYETCEDDGSHPAIRRDMIISGVKVRTEKHELTEIFIGDLCGVFLSHGSQHLYSVHQEHNKRDTLERQKAGNGCEESHDG